MPFEENGVRHAVFNAPGTDLVSFQPLPYTQLPWGRFRRNGDDGYDQGNDHKFIAASAVTTNMLYLGDGAGMASFYEARLSEVNQTLVTQILTKWLHVLEPTRKRKFGPCAPRDSKQTPEDLEPGACPPWWPKNTPYLEPQQLEKHRKIFLSIM